MNDDTFDADGRTWLIHANGGRQLIDRGQFDLGRLAEQARRFGGHLVVEGPEVNGGGVAARAFEPPVSALAALFRARLARIHACKVPFDLQVRTRPTNRVLGNYYKTRRLIRLYSHDTDEGRRPLEELFDTFLHELAHHLEYTEFDSFDAEACGRVPGRMHSRLFWTILGRLKDRWRAAQGRPTA